MLELHGRLLNFCSRGRAAQLKFNDSARLSLLLPLVSALLIVPRIVPSSVPEKSATGKTSSSTVLGGNHRHRTVTIPAFGVLFPKSFRPPVGSLKAPLAPLLRPPQPGDSAKNRILRPDDVTPKWGRTRGLCRDSAPSLGK